MFEYRVISPALRWNRDAAAELEATFNRLGEDGWELVCKAGGRGELFVFKRAVKGKIKAKG